MANLIIKPQNTSGDKVIIQDQAGGAVLTTADSGATIANATLNSPTMITPALGTPASGVVTNLTGALGSNITFPAGHILQVKSTSMGDRLVMSDTDHDSWVDIAGLSVQITPSSSSNKILVFASVKGNAGQSVACFLRTMRDSTAVGIGNASGSRSRVSAALKEITAYDIQSTDWNFLDSPAATSTLTYKIQVYSNGDIVINGGTTTADNWSSGNAHSSITVMEIKA